MAHGRSFKNLDQSLVLPFPRVMADELASWKAVTDSKYRECNAALETLLQEHMQLTTTIASANR